LKYTEAEIQATLIKIKGPLNDITIATVYSPPKHNLKPYQFQKFFHNLGKTFIAGGDLNSKSTLWGSRLKTTKERELEKVLQDKNYTPLSTGTPTYWPTDPNKIPDLLDFFVTSGISPSYMDIKQSYDLSSDHSPTILTISTTIATNVPTA